MSKIKYPVLAFIFLIHFFLVSYYSVGDNHSLVASSLTDLGQLNRIKGDYSEARSLFELALAIYSRLSDAEGVKCKKDIAMTYRRIGMTYKEQNMFAEAFQSINRALQVYTDPSSGLAANSLQVADVLNELAQISARLSSNDGGGLNSTIIYLTRALEIRERRLGRHHKDTAQVKFDLAVTLRLNGVELAKKAKLVQFNEDTARSMSMPTAENTLAKSAAYETSMSILVFHDAAKAFEEAYEDSNSEWGRSIFNLKELANVYKELGDILIEEQMWSEATPVFERYLRTLLRIYKRNKSNSNGGGGSSKSSDGGRMSPAIVAYVPDKDASRATALSLLGASEASDDAFAKSALNLGSSDRRLMSQVSVTESVLEGSDEGKSKGLRDDQRVFDLDLKADTDEVAMALSNAGLVCLRNNRKKRAKQLYRESLEIRVKLGKIHARTRCCVMFHI